MNKPAQNKHPKKCTFNTVKEVSAKDLYGGKWKNKLKKHLSPELIFEYSIKDGLSPIDISLLAIKNNQYQHYKEGDKIKVKVTEGNPAYNKEMVVLGPIKNHTLLAFPYLGESQGEFTKVKSQVIPLLKVGKYIMREENGMKLYDTPKKVQGISKEKDFVFVEGSTQKIPVEKIQVVNYNAADAAPEIDPSAFEEEEDNYTKPGEEEKSNENQEKEGKVIKLKQLKKQQNSKKLLAAAAAIGLLLLISN